MGTIGGIVPPAGGTSEARPPGREVASDDGDAVPTPGVPSVAGEAVGAGLGPSGGVAGTDANGDAGGGEGGSSWQAATAQPKVSVAMTMATASTMNPARRFTEIMGS
jgi:hypothetical protein